MGSLHENTEELLVFLVQLQQCCYGSGGVGESFGEFEWHGATQLLPQKPAQALQDTEPRCCPLPLTPCPSLVSFLIQGCDPLQPQGFSALNAPREWALFS